MSLAIRGDERATAGLAVPLQRHLHRDNRPELAPWQAIVNIALMAAVAALTESSDFSVSKVGVRMLSRCPRWNSRVIASG
jgi:NAD(P)-dependent dehydrogenase (short-subunit alcohol dehydrogenase family)